MQKIFNSGPLDQGELVDSMSRIEKRRNNYLAERRARSRLKSRYPEEYEIILHEELFSLWTEEVKDVVA